EVATVLLPPVAVWVEQQVDSPIEAQAPVLVEVRVYLQEAAALDLVEPATYEVWIGYEALDSGQGLEELDEHRRVELGQEVAGRGRQTGLVVGGELPLLRIVEALRVRDLTRL